MEFPHIEQDQKSTDTPFVVGVGSSAGGIEALINLISALPKSINASFIIAQHLSPSHKSQMTEILARETQYVVEEASQQCKIKANTIYVGPPGYHLKYQSARLVLDKQPSELAPKPSVNLLFESLADEIGDHAVGVILSGTGSDGARGLKAIKSVGGFAFVQDPATAKYDGMPKAALENVAVDGILEPQEMGQEIAHITQNMTRNFFNSQDDDRNTLMSELYSKIRESTKIDFSFYKQSTLLRRVNRRLIATQTTDLKDYLQFLDDNADEVVALSKELLISVTDFFRDTSAFNAIRRHIEDIVDRKKDGDNVRLWVAGCATGEEAYSIAITFLEAIEKAEKDISLQVFATDIDEDALGIARKGTYSVQSMGGIAPALIDKYFRYANDGYQPQKPLRDVITFSRQDITRDPPFLNLDMVSFRNVLIYFNSELQRRVLSLFRYSLLKHGVLFLGKSESIGATDDMFVPLDRRNRIFKVSETSKRPNLPKMLKSHLTPPRNRDTVTSSYENIFTQAVLDGFGPSLLINDKFTILHSHGDLDPFIRFPTGSPDLNLSKLISAPFSAELISCMNKAGRTGEIAQSRAKQLESDQDKQWQMRIMPLEKHAPSYFLVNFFSVTATVAAAPAEEVDSSEADIAELIAAREQLQTLTEEMAASAEEMQALNEEVQAANEELQANNEELEATNEELQATNEELISVNEESMRKSAELVAVNSELVSVYNTLDFPILVFDMDLCLNRTNDAANRRFHLNNGSFNKPLDVLNFPDYFEDIERRLNKTLQTGVASNIIIKPSSRETYNVFVTPIVNTRERITGAIIVIIDNSELVLAHERIEKSQEQLLSIMNNSLAVIALKDNAGRYEFVNSRFEEVFDLSAEDVVGKTDLQIFERELAKQFRDKDLDTMRALSPVETVDEFTLATGKVTLNSVRFPIFDAEGTIKSICTQATDITNERHANEQLRLAGKIFERTSEAILVMDANRTIVTANETFTQLTGYATRELTGNPPDLLHSKQHSKAFYKELETLLHEQGFWQGEIITTIKDGSDVTLWLTLNAVRDGEGNIVNYIGSFSDVGEIQNMQRRIEYLATHDELTGLPNRSVLLERLVLMIGNAKRDAQLCAVLFIDLDEFKPVNDNLGHKVGDLLLKQVTKRLNKCIRDTDLLARLGGDEFVALVSASYVDEVDDIAQRIIENVMQEFRVASHRISVSASIGIAIYPNDGVTSDILLQRADEAMYHAKSLGRAQYQYYTKRMKDNAQARVDIEQKLRQALAEDHFSLVYQPQYEIATNSVVGVEALLRVTGDDGEILDASQFIDVAEKGDLIESTGWQTLELVAEDIKKALNQGIQLPRIAINLSGKQLLATSFNQQFNALLKRTNLSAEMFKFEISERDIQAGEKHIFHRLHNLKSMGCTISVDDFGHYHSAISHLHQSGASEIKLSHAIMEQMKDDDADALLDAFLSVAKALNIAVIADQVGTEAQLNSFVELGCEIAQGYQLSAPLLFKDLLEKVR
ncbi:EAL domain-containing protein [Alteromonas sp. 345S023]|uniref:EAL domain-containing protein n=1 Tax=Alteromonas profundi TaxID=2696062 RepID=A0A7X5RKZ3_9ALTE|nr:chemotaxis protein CheB [Alteromonas profundi]NDV91503.1 EAL domain-containing protein [Alteromonas profundi]